MVKGRTPAEALKKAEKLGALEAKGASGGLTINGKSGKMVFEGVRKIMSVMNPFDMKQSDRPDDGTDITHSEFGVRNQAELKKLVRGKQVTVEYYDYGPPPRAERRRKKD